MTTKTFSLGPQPEWYLVDNVGKPTAGFLFTYDNLNLTQFKPTYQDIGGTLPNTNPIRFAENGTAPPIYFQFDSATPNDNAYYLVFKDENNNLLYDVPNYIASGGGGGSNISTAVNLKNYTGNNVYEYNIGSTIPAGPSVPNNRFLAPSNHMNFIDPDIRFFNNAVGALDSITFPEFVQGSNPLTGDVTPQYYLQYDCTSIGGDTFKYIQFPIQPKVTTLDSQQITVKFWARSTIGASTVAIQIKQFYGTPTLSVVPTITDFTPIGVPISLTGNWVQYTVTGTIPSVSLKTLSPTGDDAVYLIFNLPTAAITTIQLTKVSMYLGTSAPISDFNSFQQIEALIESPRTGDLKAGMQYATYIPKGWIAFDTGGLGDAVSQAGHNNSNTPNTWFLFNMIWNSTTNAQCQLHSQGPAFTPINRGTSAQNDWENHTVLSMPISLGCVIANIFLGHVTGESGGSETVSLTDPQNGPHTHGATTTLSLPNGQLLWNDGVNRTFSFSAADTNAQNHRGGSLAATTTIASSGSGAPHNNIQPTTYIPYIIKL